MLRAYLGFCTILERLIHAVAAGHPGGPSRQTRLCDGMQVCKRDFAVLAAQACASLSRAPYRCGCAALG